MSGEFTLEDEKLYLYMKELLDRENVFIEPSSCAAFAGPCRIQSEDVCLEYLKEQGLEDKMEKASHIVWATGGSLVPEDVRESYIQKAIETEEKAGGR